MKTKEGIERRLRAFGCRDYTNALALCEKCKYIIQKSLLLDLLVFFEDSPYAAKKMADEGIQSLDRDAQSIGFASFETLVQLVPDLHALAMDCREYEEGKLKDLPKKEEVGHGKIFH